MIRLDGMPVKGNQEDGDSMLWAGLLSAVGDTVSQSAIKRCQGADGRLWRSPRRVDVDTKNTFSRDMALGFILYFCVTKDHEMADKWIKYIRKTGKLFPKEQSTDNRYMMTPGIWWLMSYAGMKVPFWWRMTRPLYRFVKKTEIATAPAGYQRHLNGVALLIMALSTGKRDRDLGYKLWMKEPGNAFFAWLAGVNGVQAMSDHLKMLHDAHPGDGSQWCWERTDKDNAWQDSMGWDFYFIDQLSNLNIK